LKTLTMWNCSKFIRKC